MSEQEYLVLDELYFLQSFEELVAQTNLSAHDLKLILGDLQAKGWIKSLRNRESEEPAGAEELATKYASLFFLATKAGLLAHNSR